MTSTNSDVEALSKVEETCIQRDDRIRQENYDRIDREREEQLAFTREIEDYRNKTVRANSIWHFFDLPAQQQAFRMREEAVQFACRLWEGTGDCDGMLNSAVDILNFINGEGVTN